ncbi:MAG: response regulator [Planctomycetota bacterium]|jgi:CheY-like chemotaxis protein
MKRILVVDDDSFARDLYRTLLEEAGYHVTEADDGDKGLAKFRAEKFDLVILDMYMPGMDGLDAIDEINPEESGVPVIAVSGSGADGGAGALRLAETLGATKTFDKSFEHDEFLAAVKEVLGE